MGMIATDNRSQLRIVLYPDPILQTLCQRVTEFDERLAAVAARMLELMREAHGVGLAAPQVGLPMRMFVCNPSGQPGEDVVCVNPELSDFEGAAEAPEGCLSIPGAEVSIRRALRARIRFVDLVGQERELVGEGMTARVWQHETDHLNGKLIIDSLSPADEIANRRVLKQLRAKYRPPRGKRTAKA